YTSGSTGEPKGVVGTHRNVLNSLVVLTDRLRITHDDRLTLLHSLSFGSALTDFYPALLNGASLFPFDIKSEGIHRLASWLREEQITVYHSPPVVFRQVADALSGQEELRGIRLIHLSGAPITQLDFELYKRTFPQGTFFEVAMGSTEARGICCAMVDQSFSFPKEGSPVGYPYPGKKILLLDENGHEVGPNDVGEIAVKGRNLNPGYWRRAELTGSKFLPDPTGGEERVYLTGDLGRMMPDGFLIHLGRKDFQVKIRGYRVEIGEIERALSTHPEVRDTGVVAWDGEPGEKYLVAYVVAREDAAPTINELYDFLKGKLPDYMMPSAFVFLDSLPLTNGKLDRTALPPLDHRKPNLKCPYVPPRTDMERRLLRIWEEVLGLDGIGIHDNFFDLGGHSLLGARLIAQIQERFAVDLPLRSLFESPTAAQLAAGTQAARETSARTEKDNGTYLFELQSGAQRAPIFFFPGGGGGEPEFFIYASLARHVGPEYPFYGLRARGADGISQPHRSVEQMAADYLKEIQAAQPQGPYFLVGECFGGVVAQEAARQLHQRGQRVACLALIDTEYPTKRRYFAYRISTALQPLRERYLVSRLSLHWQQLRQLAGSPRLAYLFTKAGKALLSLPYLLRHKDSIRSRAHVVLQADANGSRLDHLERIREHYRRTLRRHKPKPYGGPIHVLINEEWYRRHRALGWAKLARGGMEVHKVPGDHDTYIREHVREMAAQLKQCLEKAASALNQPISTLLIHQAQNRSKPLSSENA
ncbi:MAG: non-ribosomal peptide synthetase, partial [Candidatus Binatia bacterium]